MKPELEAALKLEWYNQSCPGRPIYMVGVGGLPMMQKTHGFSYRTILATYQDDYCEWKYPQADLTAIAERIFRILEKDPNYLEKIRSTYNQEVSKQESVFRKAEGDLSQLSDEELVDLCQRHWVSRGYTVGTSHVIESLALAFEHKIRHELLNRVTGTKLNEDFSVLTTPLSTSFVSQKEELLWKIKHASESKKPVLVKKFLKAFYWVNTSYNGSQILSTEDVIKEAESLETFVEPDILGLKAKKEALMKQYHFSEKQKWLIRWTDFVTEWQDDRKKKIFRGVHGCQRIVNELARRFKIDPVSIEYFAGNEITLEKLNSNKIESIGKERKAGVLSIENPKEAVIFEHSDFLEYQKRIQTHHAETEALNGTCASLGNATGPVRVLLTFDSISQMKEGEVLVTSMTRPEFVPAMKKASAIVTDEGGITSHAAIVSRELGKPCVIGTKMATKVLKNGWIVQVKANHGQVIVLEREKA